MVRLLSQKLAIPLVFLGLATGPLHASNPDDTMKRVIQTTEGVGSLSTP